MADILVPCKHCGGRIVYGDKRFEGGFFGAPRCSSCDCTWYPDTGTLMNCGKDCPMLGEHLKVTCPSCGTGNTASEWTMKFGSAKSGFAYKRRTFCRDCDHTIYVEEGIDPVIQQKRLPSVVEADKKPEIMGPTRQTQCPNCGGYVIDKIDHTRFAVGFMIWSGFLSLGSWLIFTIPYVIAKKARHARCEECKYGYSCQLCGYKWLWRPGEVPPTVKVRPELIQIGQEHIRRQTQIEQDAAAAQFLSRQK